MAALSHAVGTRVKVTNGSYKNTTGTVQVRDGHKVIVSDKDNAVLFGAHDRMVEVL
ncbi:hypothetical protein SEA_SAMISTI12_110 [Streptomyces phage Samisti12]|uniref:KOW domain-containing protein n=5 Tax=Samistivirus TaxID=2560220 RepID=A0A223G008_9CAUD|nr:hypothetical protein FDI38_gp162 [Streptomyces phage Peebs]YP_009611542.1 hypothetical protein FDI39_gp160 [Streptomyces phage Samisti12]YP_010101524.1 hypothetical protein KNU49_gp164 [Streptomyces phage EGole]QAX95838.1 hypothetical protein SEA_TEUTSCH_109 [Streptomyces phage Teutsch]QRI46095.1 hypothetical protein SEA_CROSS_109 [Streptomyces phage Cross]WNN95463.1 hypothetical protein SEA_WATERMOORE_108 [Streptomyces phage Watermoore]ASR77807.1 hypothetical protein SEA_PEEBS_108 [Strept